MTAPTFLYFPLCHPDPSTATGCDVGWHTRGPGGTCRKPGKVPVGRWGDLENWTRERPPGNAAVRTGPDTGLLGIDVDSAEAQAIYDSWGLPETFTVRSGRPEGGHHYYFRWPAGLLQVPPGLDGIEIKGPGRYLVAWDSVHKSGRRYEKLGGTIADLPEAFVARLRDGARQVAKANRDCDEATPGAEEKLDAWLAMFPEAEELDYGNWGMRCPTHDSESGLSLHVKASGNHLVMIEHGGCDTATVVEAMGWQLSDLWAKELATKPAPAPAVQEPADGRKRRLLGTGAGPDPDVVREDFLTERLRTVGDMLSMPPIEWLVPGLLQVGATAQIVGPSTAGKSLWTLQTCIDMTLAGKTVVYCALEGKNGFNGRLRAQMVERDVDQLGPLYFYDLRVLLQHEKTVDALRDTVEAIGADIVVLDTLVRAAPGVKENDAGEMQQLIEQAETLKYGHDVSVWLVHHSGHDQSRGRGSSAVPAAMDNTVFIFPDGSNDGKEGRELIVKVFSDKIKDGRQADTLRLRRHEHRVGTLRDGMPWTSVVFKEADPGDGTKVENLEAKVRGLFDEGLRWTKARDRILNPQRAAAKAIWDRIEAEAVVSAEGADHNM